MTRFGLWGAAAACLVAGALTAPPMTFVPVSEAVTWVDQATDPAGQVIEPAPSATAPTAAPVVDDVTAATEASTTEVLFDASEPSIGRTATTRRTQETRPAPGKTTSSPPAVTPPPTDPGTSEPSTEPDPDTGRPDPKPVPDCPPAGDRRAEQAVELAQRCKAKN